jgi:hypothetical protein
MKKVVIDICLADDGQWDVNAASKWGGYPQFLGSYPTRAEAEAAAEAEAEAEGWEVVLWSEEEEEQEGKRNEMKQTILDTISDLCSDFLYYDRKEDEDLTMEQLNEAVKNGEITIDEMVAEFRKHLENTFK